jgi:hypothetical protein
VRRLRTISALTASLAAFAATASSVAGGTVPAPKGFFGIVPQTEISDADAARMRAGGIEAVRVPVTWYLTQPTAQPEYDWSGVDHVVEVASRHGLSVLPFLYGTPAWLAGQPTRLPIDTPEARRAWVAFVKAAVGRYGPGGQFWAERVPEVGGVEAPPVLPSPLPIRSWQVWNEANFFYFAYPASPRRYARLLKLTAPAIRAVDPGARIVLSGLFGNPDEGGRRGMDASRFLGALYRTPGVKADFDAVSLHPYAFHVEDLEGLTEAVRDAMLIHRDGGSGLYVTEMGWGSQNDPHQVAFEQGLRGQARELRGAYRYLLENRRRLNLEGAFWFSWKDVPPGACDFCDSVGLFRRGARFRAKPAWHSFVALAGGGARP